MLGKLFSKFKKGLEKTSEGLTDGIKSLFTGGKLDNETLEMLEDLLIQADMGVDVASDLTAQLRKTRFDEETTDEDVRRFLAEKITATLLPCEKPFQPADKKPFVLLMVGVNGSGKTTTIGKLAALFKGDSKNILLAAGDTYRAGAVEQLAIWAERTHAPIIKPEKEGADPAGVIYTAYEQAVQQNMDMLIADTAGRLQNRKDLMEQLAKIVRVLKKKDDSAPHATLLVLDATVGQNAFNQVEAFKEIANVTGLVITKLDSSAKGGVIVGLAEKFGLPIYYVGIGESLDDLKPFDANAYAYALMDIS